MSPDDTHTHLCVHRVAHLAHRPLVVRLRPESGALPRQHAEHPGKQGRITTRNGKFVRFSKLGNNRKRLTTRPLPAGVASALWGRGWWRSRRSLCAGVKDEMSTRNGKMFRFFNISKRQKGAHRAAATAAGDDCRSRWAARNRPVWRCTWRSKISWRSFIIKKKTKKGSTVHLVMVYQPSVKRNWKYFFGKLISNMFQATVD